jgi:hypothetical protein
MMRMPSKYKGFINRKQWQFAKQLVLKCSCTDTLRYNSPRISNEEIHQRTDEIMDIIIQRRLMTGTPIFFPLCLLPPKPFAFGPSSLTLPHCLSHSPTHPCILAPPLSCT